MTNVMTKASLARVLGELAVIVAGILIALAADAWWQGRTEAKQEQEYLEAFRLDLQATLRAAEFQLERQDSIRQATLRISRTIASGDPLPDTLLRIFPPVTILGESMDTYRDLVASGGTTRITSLEVRRAMSQALARVEFSRVSEEWALELVTSMRSAVLVLPRPVDRDRLAELWAVYDDAGSRVINGKRRLMVAADSALAIVEAELAGR